jgi:hypothetical protein
MAAEQRQHALPGVLGPAADRHLIPEPLLVCAPRPSTAQTQRATRPCRLASLHLPALCRTQFEAYLSLQHCCSTGLEPSNHTSSRCTPVCIHNATAEREGAKILEMWKRCTVEDAYRQLSAPDVMVTNLSVRANCPPQPPRRSAPQPAGGRTRVAPLGATVPCAPARWHRTRSRSCRS